ncbi:very short patch repair endonuclease [Novosphingobium lentum]|uniref:very short patch repair endonuclease n=1 Tax=Novosphingobium lentum TaxID=145287 RepID=UPI000A0644C4|nr:very short patch repair endonuclease [Novosphingobium lentum]
MTDVVSPEVRSRMMSGIRGKNTRPELMLRQALHALGFRYRLHAPELPGKPDLAFPKHQAIIQVHGCFWHRHGCDKTSIPSSNSEFWQKKFERNIERDREVELQLRELGWRVGVVWECEIGRRLDPLLIDKVSHFLVNHTVDHIR